MDDGGVLNVCDQDDVLVGATNEATVAEPAGTRVHLASDRRRLKSRRRVLKQGAAAAVAAVAVVPSPCDAMMGARARLMGHANASVPTVTITTASPLAGGTQGSSYSVTLSGTDSASLPLSWSLSAGSLPTGLSISAGGVISGTPSAGGTFSFTVMASDSDGGSATKGFSITVTATQTVNYTVTSNVNNIDFRTLMLAAGWVSSNPLNGTLTINGGVTVGSANTSSYALTVTGSFPSGSSLKVIINGTVCGAGGAGGGMNDGVSYPYPWAKAGGPAIYASVPVSIVVNGNLWAGGGGGGGNADSQGGASCGGGGGGGTAPGAGGFARFGNIGVTGTATAGGSGKRPLNHSGGGSTCGATGNGGVNGPGGNGGGTMSGGISSWGGTITWYRNGAGGGGAPGYSGGTGGSGWNTSPYSRVVYGAPGAAPGYYITGNAYVTWSGSGSRLGRVQ